MKFDFEKVILEGTNEDRICLMRRFHEWVRENLPSQSRATYKDGDILVCYERPATPDRLARWGPGNHPPTEKIKLRCTLVFRENLVVLELYLEGQYFNTESILFYMDENGNVNISNFQQDDLEISPNVFISDMMVFLENISRKPTFPMRYVFPL